MPAAGKQNFITARISSDVFQAGNMERMKTPNMISVLRVKTQATVTNTRWASANFAMLGSFIRLDWSTAWGHTHKRLLINNARCTVKLTNMRARRLSKSRCQTWTREIGVPQRSRSSHMQRLRTLTPWRTPLTYLTRGESAWNVQNRGSNLANSFVLFFFQTQQNANLSAWKLHFGFKTWSVCGCG